MSEIVNYDLTGTDSISEAVKTLLNSCPFLDEGETVSFASLQETGGIAFYPTGGAVVLNERRSITDHISQECLYNFAIVNRSYGQNERRKMTAKEFTDSLGKWLERQSVSVGGALYKLESYPDLTGGREIRSISRQSSATLDATTEDQSELWVINMRLTYRNEYDEQL